jgi:hypothetical protein
MRMCFLGLFVVACWATRAHAQAVVGSPEDTMPMADYLGLLEQITPAARAGAEAYIQANQQRCARQLTTAELRRAMSQAGGDPVLMGMIRAAHLRDAQAMSALAQSLKCGARK